MCVCVFKTNYPKSYMNLFVGLDIDERCAPVVAVAAAVNGSATDEPSNESN